MTDLQMVLLATSAFWLAVLTLVVSLLVRQLGLVALKLEQVSTFAPMSDGPSIGAPAPTWIDEYATGEGADPVDLLLVSATCGPCRELVQAMKGREWPRLLVLVPGSETLAEAIASELPTNAEIFRDPLASQFASDLAIRSTPYAVRFRSGVVEKKSSVRSAEDFAEFVEVHGSRIHLELAGRS